MHIANYCYAYDGFGGTAAFSNAAVALAEQYQIVYDVSQSGFSHIWWFPAGGLIAIAGGILSFACPGLFRSKPRPVLSLIGTAFAVLWTMTTWRQLTNRYLQLLTALEENRCGVVEGQVTNFHPMPYTGHTVESFDVGNCHFSYSDNIVTPGFNNTRSHGGPIQEGEQVRIHYLDNEIARLEISR